MNDARTPDVSVIIGAYEAMPYLVRCLESVEAQTIGPHRMEVVAVDDGSTDGTGEYLEEFAARSSVPTRVIRQQNSGGPSGPRNVGLGLARGRYVFFLDADDYFGDEALERMVEMADRAGTDVVLGKVVGVNRGAPQSMWSRTEERVDVHRSKVIYTLSAQKLFRREMLERCRLRFDEDLRTGEDALFTMEAYLRGAGVSVISDYTCYHLVGRDDGKHVTKTGSYTLRFEAMAAMMALIHRLEPPGPKRDLLMVRPFTVGLLQQFAPGLLKRPESEQRHRMELAAPLMKAYWTDGVARRIKVGERLRLVCVAHGRLDLLADVLTFLQAKQVPELVSSKNGDKLFLAYPHFRDPQAGFRDADYEVTVPDWHGDRRIQKPKKAARPAPTPPPSAARRAARRVRRDLRRWKARLTAG
ncbi:MULTISPECIES: glycosyltransferase family 2 protein [unclassified Streptomyces]|uniref:glycosyltransferase family 2 protein n=1 Tax=Streptomyces TaxID=1883 RepID=UPI000399C697|nr:MULTISPECIES: glycosyltransferase family 2 protein [unclassified Streptomyces]MYR70561.1 glycosyltransferase [Streptomyces sp. SID4939]MYR99647.1 glycosyltransferase [Streptomyces sp. SID4940]MYT64232.1 glycosyltransferase [Streptomyces sp. SID8357]MYT87045.1 glycosyltransferase [Streptomyces sp. SID8360]MYU34493.1 glycosyltransferase [Streptomyces sp. SID8358]MYW37392.1 glycosyltransferase [Streptomyces sp. SID1]MYX72080.1 glycosyltransferase [Streptomyces sp. SID3915]